MPGEPAPAGRGLRTGARPARAEWLAEYVYGVIGTLVALGTLSFRSDVDPISACGNVLVGAIAVWLAHAVAQLVADWARQEPIRLGLVVHRLRHTWPILSAALPASAILLLSSAGFWPELTGLWVSDGVAVLTLAGIGMWVAAGSSEPPLRRVAYVVALVGVGGLIVGLELAAHYL